MNEKLDGLLKKIKEPKYIFILGAVGVIIIIISSFFTGNGAKTAKNEKFDREEYRLSLQNDVKKIVAEISGDKKATVLITLENGIRYSYADDTKDDLSTTGGENSEETKRKESSHITIKNASGDEEALVITENMPEVRGVAVICTGGDDEYLAENITNAIMATLNITSKRVYVTGKN